MNATHKTWLILSVGFCVVGVGLFWWSFQSRPRIPIDAPVAIGLRDSFVEKRPMSRTQIERLEEKLINPPPKAHTLSPPSPHRPSTALRDVQTVNQFNQAQRSRP